MKFNKNYTKNHDLPLSDWGPYSKLISGVSHIANREMGLRFDTGCIPGLFRRRLDVPVETYDGRHYPLSAAQDLSRYAIRHELIEGEKLICDIEISDLVAPNNEGNKFFSGKKITATFVNHTENIQNAMLHLTSALLPPTLGFHSKTPLISVVAKGLSNATVHDCCDYKEYVVQRVSPKDNLIHGGYQKGEKLEANCVNCRKLVFINEGDNVTFLIPEDSEAETLTIRYRLRGEQSSHIVFSGAIEAEKELPVSDEFTLLEIGNRVNNSGNLFTIKLVKNLELELDCFLLGSAKEIHSVKFIEIGSLAPQIREANVAGYNQSILHWNDFDLCYGICILDPNVKIRQIETGDLATAMKFHTHNHVSKFISHEEGDVWNDIFTESILIAPQDSQIVHALVIAAPANLIDSSFLKLLTPNNNQILFSEDASVQHDDPEVLWNGQRLLSAVTMQNIVFPVRCKEQWIRHFTPGKWWDSLYTWDSGFIGIGLSEISEKLCEANLNTYLTVPGDPHSAFIHHGSIVPTQFYQFHSLLNKLGAATEKGKMLLEKHYPSLRQYYQFICGKFGSSTTAHHKSGLLQAWDYFYNSGGWDDYSPQKYVHAQELEHKVTPVVLTAHVIRCAKLLELYAELLGIKEHIREYKTERAVLTDALLNHSWDEKSGWFSYVTHDETGEADGYLMHESGQNYNQGLDGVSPLISGICPEKIEQKLIENIFDSTKLWTPIGITAVSQSAPYYNKNGYWNGAVWMPHQWFLWKTMLDIGRPELAWKIAKTALDLWEKETGATHRSFEHFHVPSGRGCGWHQFSGLSTPVLSWYAAYYFAGTITTGFDSVVLTSENKAGDTPYVSLLTHEDASPRGHYIIATGDHEGSIRSYPVTRG